MVLKYVLKSFRRRRVRTILMVLSLVVSTGLLVAMSATIESIRHSTVDLVTSEIGRYDLTVRRTETSSEPFVTVDEVSQRLLAADDSITAVYPRFLSDVELYADGERSTGSMLARDPTDGIGQVEVISGTYSLGSMQAAVTEEAALALGGPGVGDTVEVAYSFPIPRERGSLAEAGSSQRRAVGRFIVSGIVRTTGVGPELGDGALIVALADAQSFLGLPNRAEMFVALVEPALYDAGNAEAAALRVRDVAVKVQAALDATYEVRAQKASTLYEAATVFMVLQALTSVYGLMSLSVVGLLVYTLVMTNVQEQRREMAILRILGGRRKVLFGIVVVEVLVIGAVGVGAGIMVGQAITSFGVVPLIEHLMRQEGQTIALKPVVSLTAILPAILSAFAVLLLSAIKPARDASKTKVVHAINPGVADNIQLEDLEHLRERGTSLKLFFIGLAILAATLIFNIQVFGEMFGNPLLEEMSFLVTWFMLAVGLAAVFFILTRPLERLILFVTGLAAPRLTYFARRNVARGVERNTLISLLVLLSGVLPSFLATQSAIDFADIEREVRLNLGAPVSVRIWSWFGGTEFETLGYLRTSFLRDEVEAVPGVDQAVGVTYGYEAGVRDSVNMRRGQANLVGVSSGLGDVLFDDLMVWTAGGPSSFSRLQEDPYAVIISQGMAEGLAVPLGGSIVVHGQGLDHEEELTVVGIAQKLPGFDGIGRRRSRALEGGTALVSVEAFQRLSTDPKEPAPHWDDPIFERVLATKTADADPQQLRDALHEVITEEHGGWPRVAELAIRDARNARASQRIFLLVLTLLSFITAVFGVFAIIYVTIYSRRREIGMMKAFGARNRELNGMLSVESVAMTLGAALAGILAGTTMAFVLMFINTTIAERPMRFAVDNTVLPAIVILVSTAAVIGTFFSARRIVKHKAVEILRMS